MIGVAAIWTPPKAVYLSTNFSFKSKTRTSKGGCISSENPLLVVAFPFSLSALPPPINHYSKPLIASSAASAGFTDYVEEPATNVKFQTSLTIPGCSTSLSLLGTGFREKIFAIIGVKVYAAGLYVDLSALSELDAAKRKSAEEIQGDASFFDIIFQATLEKSLQIVLVRDVDGKTFWGALDDAISPRIKSPTPDDESAISTFRSIFLGRSLKKGTFVFLTWLDPTKMLVSVSSAGMPSSVDASIESENVSLALFDVFFGDGPVSPTLKDSVSKGLATAFK